MNVFDKGAAVRQVLPEIEGEVVERKFDDATGQMQYLVAYQGFDGEAHTRWFAQSELELAAAGVKS